MSVSTGIYITIDDLYDTGRCTEEDYYHILDEINELDKLMTEWKEQLK